MLNLFQKSPKKQLKLLLEKRTAKLINYIGYHKLAKEAEMITNPNGLEDLLQSYLERYGCFIEENNLLFINNSEKYPHLLSLSQKIFSEKTDSEQTLLAALLIKALQLKEAKDLFMLIDKDIKSFKSLVQNLNIADSTEGMIFLTTLYPGKTTLHKPEVFKEFARIASLETFQEYATANSLPQEMREALLETNRWDLVNFYFLHYNQFAIGDLSKFADFVEYNQQKPGVVERYLISGKLPENFLQYLIKQKEWQLVGYYLINFKDSDILNLSSPYPFYAILKTHPQCRPKLKLAQSVEAGLFEDGQQSLLFGFAEKNWFCNHETIMCFLMLINSYPQEVTAYLQKYGKNISLDENEQLALLQKDISVIQFIADIAQTAEALLFNPEHRKTLLDYAKKTQFRHHQNEFRFLMMSKVYAEEVDQYLARYGKKLKLEEDELEDFLKENKKSVTHLQTSNLKMFKRHFLPELRQTSQLDKCDISMLISLSHEHPVLLINYLKAKRISAEDETKLFFCADESVRLFYAKEYGFKFSLLIDQMHKYGATQEEQKAALQYFNTATSISKNIFAGNKKYYPADKKYYVADRKICNLVPIPPQEINCDTCHLYGKCRSNCSEMRDVLTKAPERAVKILYNIALRNYLTA